MWLQWAWVAPQQLSQPINPGWSFGNIIVNDHNSSAPSTEQAIIAEESYGRQIGKLPDAVYDLCRQTRVGTPAPIRRSGILLSFMTRWSELSARPLPNASTSCGATSNF
jgi:hypothetical protein